jgi:hypothetical protein
MPPLSSDGHDDSDEEDDYNDDESEDEDDFVPDDDDEDEDDEESMLLSGAFTIDIQDRLVFQGDGFLLTSVKAIETNVLLLSSELSSQLQLKLQGPFQYEGSSAHRVVDITIMQVAADEYNEYNSSSVHGVSNTYNGEIKKQSSTNSKSYRFYGRQVSDAMPKLEFQGTFSPTETGELVVCYSCQVRRLVDQDDTTTDAAKPAAAAAAVARLKKDADDDDDDDDNDAVDFDELLALRQEASVPVNQLKRRYAEGSSNNGDSLTSKKGKRAQDESDDEIGF